MIRLKRSFFSACLNKSCLYKLFFVSIISLLWIAPGAAATEDLFSNLHVVKKPGEQTSSVLVTVKGKPKVLAKRALQAWTIMEGQNALVLVERKNKAGKDEYQLRFYEGVSRKYRELGTLPFFSAELEQGVLPDGGWAFALSGTIKGQAWIAVAGLHGVHGLLKDAHGPKLHDGSMTYLDTAGGSHIATVKALLAADMTGIYEVPSSSSDSNIHYVQFLRDGTAVMVAPNGEPSYAKWRTDGVEMFVIQEDGTIIHWPQNSLVPVRGVPASTRLAVRLLQPLTSEKTNVGEPVEAALISPASIQGEILLPQGSIFSGAVTKVHRVSWGFRRETAALTIEFNSVKLPDGAVLAVHTQMDRVENSRETVGKDGTIKGVRSTGTPAYAAERKIASISAIDPVSYLFTSVSAIAVLGFADPAISYPAGTEVLVQFTSPAITNKSYPREVPEFSESPAEQDKLYRLVRGMSYRTATKAGNKPSDLTNLIFIGPADGLQRAFHAAGWTETDTLTADSTFNTLKAVGGNRVYHEAPMSTLMLDEHPPIFTLSKTTNTFAARHHARVFDAAMKFDGATVLTASSTQDIAVAFSGKQKTFIHVIDEYIDNERSKIVNDLEFTGCVSEMSLVARPWVPQDAYNSTGDHLRTDGAVAVIRLNDCQNPRTTPTTPAPPVNKFKRNTRNTMLYIRDDLFRGNFVYSGISSALWVKKYLSTKDQLKPDTGAWRTSDLSGTTFRGRGNDSLGERPRERGPGDFTADRELAEQTKALEQLHKWDPPHYEIGLFGGYTRFPSTRNEAIAIIATPDATDPNSVFAAILADEFDGGWMAGTSVTINSWKWFSNQFAYSYTHGHFAYVEAFSDPIGLTIYGSSGLVTNQFEYNLLWNLRPPKSRWRPYAAAGPAMVLTHLSDSPVKKAAGPFKLGLQNIGLFLAAYDFGSTPPLNGGGVFALGAVYGAGFKYRVRPRITFNVDFRETLCAAPKFLSDSYTKQYFVDQNYNTSVYQFSTDSKYRQQRFTAGVAFTF